MSLSSALKAGLGARLKDLSGEGAGWDPYPDGAGGGSGKKQANVAARRTAPRTGQAKAAPAASAPPVAKAPRPAPRPANANNGNGGAVARAPEGGRAMSRPRSQDRAAVQVNPQQYARELDRYLTEQNRHLARETVMEVATGELEGIARMAAKARGRYFAKLLDAGAPRQGFLHESEVAELRFYREMYEEITRGFDTMRDAIEAGDLGVRGMKRP